MSSQPNYERTNPLLGHVLCKECGKTAEVYQTKRRGDHFYTDACGCKFKQGNGPDRQQYIYDNMEVIEGAVVIRPSNVESKAIEGDVIVADQGKVTEKETEQSREWSPGDMKKEPSEVGPEKSSKSGKKWLAIGVFAASAIGSVLWMR